MAKSGDFKIHYWTILKYVNHRFYTKKFFLSEYSQIINLQRQGFLISCSNFPSLRHQWSWSRIQLTVLQNFSLRMYSINIRCWSPSTHQIISTFHYIEMYLFDLEALTRLGTTTFSDNFNMVGLWCHLQATKHQTNFHLSPHTYLSSSDPGRVQVRSRLGPGQLHVNS